MQCDPSESNRDIPLFRRTHEPSLPESHFQLKAKVTSVKALIAWNSRLWRAMYRNRTDIPGFTILCPDRWTNNAIQSAWEESDFPSFGYQPNALTIVLQAGSLGDRN